MKKLFCDCLLFNEMQMIALGRFFALQCPRDDAAALCGDLGSGKTTFTKGVASAFDISSEVISPSFVLLREYPAPSITLYHFDLYRLEKTEDLHDIGFFDTLALPGIKIVEWADKFPLTEKYYQWMLYFSMLSPNQRRVQVFYHA